VASLLMPLFFVTGIWIWMLRRRAAKRSLPLVTGEPLRSTA
jgi:hypothetical protein